MRNRVRRREPAQTIVIAAVAMVAVVGGLALVIDAGMFFVVQRQLQAAADAGALAGAWYNPICASAFQCKQSPPTAQEVAQTVAQANAEPVQRLCGGTVHVPTPVGGTPLNLPQRVNALVVTVECDAPFSFGRILGLSRQRISASAAAAIGDRDSNGDMTDFNQVSSNPACAADPDKCRVARLIE